MRCELCLLRGKESVIFKDIPAILGHYESVHRNICEICVDNYGVTPNTLGGRRNKRSGTFSKPRKLHEHIISRFHKHDITGEAKFEGHAGADIYYCEFCIQNYILETGTERDRAAAECREPYRIDLPTFTSTAELKQHYRNSHYLKCSLCARDTMSRRHKDAHVAFRDAGLVQRHLNATVHKTLLEDGQFRSEHVKKLALEGINSYDTIVIIDRAQPIIERRDQLSKYVSPKSVNSYIDEVPVPKRQKIEHTETTDESLETSPGHTPRPIPALPNTRHQCPICGELTDTMPEFKHHVNNIHPEFSEALDTL